MVYLEFYNSLKLQHSLIDNFFFFHLIQKVTENKIQNVFFSVFSHDVDDDRIRERPEKRLGNRIDALQARSFRSSGGHRKGGQGDRRAHLQRLSKQMSNLTLIVIIKHRRTVK